MPRFMIEYAWRVHTSKSTMDEGRRRQIGFSAIYVLRTHKAAPHEIARVLQENEVIGGDEIARTASELAPGAP